MLASNSVDSETTPDGRSESRSFIAAWQGEIVHKMGREVTGVRVHTLDLAEIRAHRAGGRVRA